MNDIRVELQASDYKALKYIEGDLSEDEWAIIKAERQALREEYQTLEGVI